MNSQVKEPLYPIVCSTAAKTEMILSVTRMEFVNLQDRCRAEIVKRIKRVSDLYSLRLPYGITQYLTESIRDIPPLKKVDNYDILGQPEGL